MKIGAGLHHALQCDDIGEEPGTHILNIKNNDIDVVQDLPRKAWIFFHTVIQLEYRLPDHDCLRRSAVTCISAKSMFRSENFYYMDACMKQTVHKRIHLQFEKSDWQQLQSVYHAVMENIFQSVLLRSERLSLAGCATDKFDKQQSKNQKK